MGFLSRLLGRPSAAPRWAACLGPEEWVAFEAELRQALAARSLPSGARAVRGGALALRAGATLGLGPIARKCRGHDRARWAALIAEHLDVALAPDDGTLALLAADFAEARTRLKVQLVPDDFVRPGWEEGLNFKTFATGVKAALVYDLPTQVRSVRPEDVRRWGRPSAELFDLAGANVRAEPEAPAVEPMEIPEERVTLQLLVGDSFFVCSHALWLDHHPEAASDRGALVAVPSRHEILFHPIRDASAQRAMTVLAAMASDLHAKLPGPISPNVFWLKDGAAALIPVHAPPSALAAALAGLAEP
jgi:hypothetical protein